MANHPNRSNYRYWEVCPRGFNNEVHFYRVPLDRAAECEAEFAEIERREIRGGNTAYRCGWTDSRRARMPGVALDWTDRHHPTFGGIAI